MVVVEFLLGVAGLGVVFAGGFWCGKTYGSVKNLATSVKGWFQ